MDSRHVSSTVMREARKTASYTAMKNLLVKIFESEENPSFKKLRIKGLVTCKRFFFACFHTIHHQQYRQEGHVLARSRGLAWDFLRCQDQRENCTSQHGSEQLQQKLSVSCSTLVDTTFYFSLYLCPTIMLLVFTLSLISISLTVNLWWLDSWASLMYGKMIASARTCIAAGSISMKASLVHKSLTTTLSTCLKWQLSRNFTIVLQKKKKKFLSHGV